MDADIDPYEHEWSSPELRAEHLLVREMKLLSVSSTPSEGWVVTIRLRSLRGTWAFHFDPVASVSIRPLTGFSVSPDAVRGWSATAVRAAYKGSDSIWVLDTGTDRIQIETDQAPTVRHEDA